MRTSGEEFERKSTAKASPSQPIWNTPHSSTDHGEIQVEMRAS